jgi:hypothetical protein
MITAMHQGRFWIPTLPRLKLMYRDIMDPSSTATTIDKQLE